MDKIYYSQFIVLPLISCFIAYICIVDGTQLSATSAVTIGAAGPAILKQLASTVPKLGGEDKID